MCVRLCVCIGSCGLLTLCVCDVVDDQDLEIQTHQISDAAFEKVNAFMETCLAANNGEGSRKKRKL